MPRASGVYSTFGSGEVTLRFGGSSTKSLRTCSSLRACFFLLASMCLLVLSLIFRPVDGRCRRVVCSSRLLRSLPSLDAGVCALLQSEFVSNVHHVKTLNRHNRYAVAIVGVML